jgi:hypothetical protein
MKVDATWLMTHFLHHLQGEGDSTNSRLAPPLAQGRCNLAEHELTQCSAGYRSLGIVAVGSVE